MFKIALANIANAPANEPAEWDALYDAYREGDVIIVESDQYHPAIQFALNTDEEFCENVGHIEDALREVIAEHCELNGYPKEGDCLNFLFKLREDSVDFIGSDVPLGNPRE